MLTLNSALLGCRAVSSSVVVALHALGDLGLGLGGVLLAQAVGVALHAVGDLGLGLGGVLAALHLGLGLGGVLVAQAVAAAGGRVTQEQQQSGNAPSAKLVGLDQV